MKRGFCCLVVAAAILVAAGSAFAGGNQAYPNGAEDIFCGMVPPPGFYAIDYNLYYTADDFKDLALDDFELDLYANVLRLIYVTPKQILGGNWAMHVFIPYMSLDGHFDAPVGTPPIMGDFLDNDVDDLGDIIIDPFILSWHWEHFHCAFGVDLFLPTGDYDEDELFNISKNNVTIEPVFAWTYMTDGGWSFNQKLMWDFSTENDEFTHPATLVEGDLEPGNEFHFDYAIDKALTPNIRAGVAGYAYWQLDEDRFEGVADPSPKSRVLAAGPLVSASFFERRLTVTAKVMPEFGARNHSRGISTWLKFIYAF